LEFKEEEPEVVNYKYIEDVPKKYGDYRVAGYLAAIK